MNKIKICHVIGDFVNGGVESIIYNYFSHMDLDKFEVHIIGHGIKVKECADRFIKLGFTIHNIPPKRSSFSKSCKAMEDIFRMEKFDIVHSHLTEWACVPMFLAWKCGVKVRINHSHMAEKPKGFKNKLYYGIRLLIGKIFATDLFACGRDAGRYLFGARKVEQGRVKIITNAIDIKKFSYNVSVRNELRDSIGISNDTIVLGHVGRFFEQKNHVFLVKIFEEYNRIIPNSHLILLGDGELKQDTQNLVDQLGLSDVVHFLGVKQNINEWYQAMDIFLLPSLYEGLPVVGIEAQASGLPCIFSDSITKEIDISKYAHFLSLDLTAIEWANTLVTIGLVEDRYNTSIDLGYDICNSAKVLEDFYLKRIIERQ